MHAQNMNDNMTIFCVLVHAKVPRTNPWAFSHHFMFIQNPRTEFRDFCWVNSLQASIPD
jgi:hypothetical protein